MRGLTAAGAERIVGSPIELRDAPDGLLLVRVAGAPESATAVGTARMFLAFHDHALATCFAVCADARGAAGWPGPGPGGAGAPSTRACDGGTAAARVEGDTPPPRAGLLLDGVTWAVHHPTEAAAWSASLTAAAAVVALITRRKPRSRI